jgi:hypothetical protein
MYGMKLVNVTIQYFWDFCCRIDAETAYDRDYQWVSLTDYIS